MVDFKKSIINMINIFNYKGLIYILIFVIISVLLYGNYNLIEGAEAWEKQSYDKSLDEKNIKLEKISKDIKKYKLDNSVKEQERQMNIINTKNTIDSISENFQNCNSNQSSTLVLNNDGYATIVDPNYISQSLCDINNNLEANVKIQRK